MEKADIANLDRAYLKFETNNQAFDLTFFQNEKGQSLRLSYENGLICLDRSQKRTNGINGEIRYETFLRN